MTALAAAIIGELDDAALAALAERLVPFLPTPDNSDDDRWMDARAAADYAGCSINSLRKAMAARAIAFEQDTPGGKAWFRRSDVDAWRRGEAAATRKRA